MKQSIRMARVLCVAGGLTLCLGACAPLLISGAVIGTTLVASDRRTSGTQLEDQGIQIKTATRIREQLVGNSHVNISAYDRKVLLTGEVPSETYKEAAGRMAAGVENVLHVYNELAVMPNTSLSDRASDGVVSTRVRAALVDARDVYANAVSIRVERNVVYLMGRVTAREATRITEVVSGIKGVQKVVRILDIISDEQLQRLQPKYDPNPLVANP